MAQEQPNILLITTDQQRYDTLGIFGNPLVQTPNLDRLVASGVQFASGFIQNPVCIPSRACIQTGRYCHQHGVEYMEDEIAKSPGLPPWETTFMERLQQVGYTAAAFGKIHMLPPKGLDEMKLTMGKGARWTVAEGSPLGPSQLGPVYASWLERKRPGAYESIYAQRREPEYKDQLTAIVNTLAADEYVDYWIGENTWEYLDRPHAEPFFAWCGFCGPHPPYDPPEPYASMYDPDEIPLPALLHARQRNVPGGNRPTRFDRPDGERLARKLIAYYWGMVSFIDEMIGKIMETMTRRGLWENTLVIFTSDHGEMLGNFGRTGKSNFTDPVTHVPYIIVPPGSTIVSEAGGTGRTYPGLVEHIDLAPTILDYTGAERTADLPGYSLRPILQGDDVSDTALARRETVFCEFVTSDRRQRRMCLRSDRYKYVFNGADQPVEFYDLAVDPDETVNVAGDPGYQDHVRRFAELLLDRFSRSQQTVWNGRLAEKAIAPLDGFGCHVRDEWRPG